MSQGSLDPKIRFLAQKLWSVACVQRNRQTDRHESENRGHPFRVSGIFPSTYHQGSVQHPFRVSGIFPSAYHQGSVQLIHHVHVHAHINWDKLPIDICWHNTSQVNLATLMGRQPSQGPITIIYKAHCMSHLGVTRTRVLGIIFRQPPSCMSYKQQILGRWIHKSTSLTQDHEIFTQTGRRQQYL